MAVWCVEGPPGAAKTAVARQLSRSRGWSFCAYQPAANDLIDQQVNPRWTFYVQLRILVDRCRSIRKGHSDRGPGTCVMVGSPTSDIHCHAGAGAMSDAEREMYGRWAETLLRGLSQTRHVLVEREEEDLYSAVVHAGRREQAHMDLRSLRQLKQMYMVTFSGQPKIVLPRNVNDNEVLLQAAVDAAVL